MNRAIRFAASTQSLLHDYDVLSDEERKKSLQSIARNGRKIGNILDALLLLAWVRKTDVQLTPLDSGSIVAEAQHTFFFTLPGV